MDFDLYMEWYKRYAMLYMMAEHSPWGMRKPIDCDAMDAFAKAGARRQYRRSEWPTL